MENIRTIIKSKPFVFGAIASINIAIIDFISVVILGYVIFLYLGGDSASSSSSITSFLELYPSIKNYTGPISISLFFILKFLLVTLSTYFFSIQVFKISAKIGMALSEKMTGTDINLQVPLTEKTNLISYNLNLLVTQLIIPTYQLITEILVCLFIIILMLYIEIKLTLLIALSILAATIPVYLLISKFLHNLSKQRSLAELGKISEMSKMHGLKYLINSLSLAPWLLNAMENRNNDIIKIGSYELTLMNIPRHFYEMLFVVILITIVSTYEIESQSMALLGVMFVRILPSLTRIQSLTNSIKMSYASRYNINKILEQDSNIFFDQVSNNISAVSTKSFTASVYWENFFTSGNNNIQLNLSMKAGDRICIVGPSGVGKSTLLNSIISLGLYMPDRVVFNEKQMQPLSAEWQTLFGIVPQTTFVYDATIKDQILLGRKFNEERFKYALKISGLDKLFDHQSILDKTISPDSDLKLSIGQEQRVGLARAVYNKPPILLLDEFTSALDHESEKEMIMLLTKIDYPCSILAITHRDEFTKICNKVINVESKTIVCKKIE